MKIKAILTDFDGTLVKKDILDVVCEIVGKEAESRRMNEEFIAGKREGLPTLTARINFLKGVSKAQIAAKLALNDFLMPGARELFSYLHAHNIVTVLHSGNILPVLQYYQRELKITHIVGTNPLMVGDCIDSIRVEDFPGKDFKLQGCKKVLESLGISPEDALAMGDAPSDKQLFEYAGFSVAVNPKNGIDKLADHVVWDSLEGVVPFIETLK